MAQESKFSVGDKVVHPQHGAATIERKVRQTFDGQRKDYFILDIATEQLTVMVPLERVDDLIVLSSQTKCEVLPSKGRGGRVELEPLVQGAQREDGLGRHLSGRRGRP
jgi:hypothetical protein